jgi:hypothetical protein
MFTFIHVCIYICSHIYICIYMFTFIHVCIYICSHIYIYTYIFIHILGLFTLELVPTSILSYVREAMKKFSYIIYIYIFIYINKKNTLTYIYMYTHKLGMFTLELVPTSILFFVREAMKEFFISTLAKKIHFVLKSSIMTEEDQVWLECFGYLLLGCSVISVFFFMLILLLMPLAGLH